MGERMFVILEVPEWQAKHLLRTEACPSIPESELRRRLRAIIALEVTGATLDELVEIAIPLLLHGEGKENHKQEITLWRMDEIKSVMTQCSKHGTTWNAECEECEEKAPESERGKDKPFPGPDDILAMRGKKATTRKDWEEWAEKVACSIESIDFYKKNAIRNELLDIPCAKEPDPNAETHDQWINRMPSWNNFSWSNWEGWEKAMKQWHREEPPK